MKILAVDDHALFLEGVVKILERLYPGVAVLAVPTAVAALHAASMHADLDLVLLDLGLPDANGATCLSQLRRHYPALPVVVLSASQDHDDVRRVLRAGASGYIPKSSTSAELQAGLKVVFEGGIYVPAVLTGTPTRRLGLARAPHLAHLAVHVHLTARERQILALLCTGDANKEIAETLGIAEGTVRIHLTSIFKALQVTNRTQAVAATRRFGLLTAGE